MRTAGAETKALEVRSGVPWYQRALSRKASYIVGSRKWYQQLGAIPIGKAVALGVVGLSTADLGYNAVFNREETSFSRKYFVPVLGIFLGLLGIGVSKPPANVFEVDVISTGVGDVVKGVKDKIKSGQNPLTDFSDEETKKLSAILGHLVNFARERILGAVVKVRGGKSEGAKVEHKEIPTEVLSLYAESREKGRKILGEIFNLRPGRATELLTELKDSINKKLNPVGLELILNSDSKKDKFDFYFRTLNAVKDPIRNGKLYSPFVRVSTKPFVLLAALATMEKSLTKVKATKNTTGGDSKTNTLSSQDVYTVLKEFIFRVYGGHNGGFFEMENGVVKSPAVVVNGNVEMVDQLLELLVQSSANVEIDEISSLSNNKVDEEVLKEYDFSDGGGDVQTDPTGTSKSGNQPSEEVTRLIDKIRHHTFNHLNFKLLNEGERREVTLLKIHLLRAIAYKYINSLESAGEKAFQKIEVKDGDTNLRKVYLIQQAFWNKIKDEIPSHEPLGISFLEPFSDKIPEALAKPEYFLEIARSTEGTDPLDKKIDKLLSLVSETQEAKIKQELSKTSK